MPNWWYITLMEIPNDDDNENWGSGKCPMEIIKKLPRSLSRCPSTFSFFFLDVLVSRRATRFSCATSVNSCQWQRNSENLN